MAFSTDWDLEKYKSEYESNEHWELRKKFMQAHKNKFPEDKLVCLARVFFNTEFLGCRYPEQTMQLIAELSAGVADEYREKQKGKLKRTFVQASDAAGAKIKGTQAPTSNTAEEPPAKSSRTSGDHSRGFGYSSFVQESVQNHLNEGEFPGFVIYQGCRNHCPLSTLTQSAQKSKIWNDINFEFPISISTGPSGKYCEIILKKKVLSTGTGTTPKEAKLKAAIEGLKKLRRTCYTIQEKLSFFSDGELISKDRVPDKETTTALPQDNVGARLMMKMGWTGSGLGKNQQGIKNPIEATQTMRRTGFGNMNNREFQQKFTNIFKDYITSESDNDLVFAPDFSAEERKILHQLAQRFKLKTKSYGKNEERHLVVYKLLTLPQIVQSLLHCGGENDKYLLHPPQTDEASFDSWMSDLMQRKIIKQETVVTNSTIIKQEPVDTSSRIIKQEPVDTTSENFIQEPVFTSSRMIKQEPVDITSENSIQEPVGTNSKTIKQEPVDRSSETFIQEQGGASFRTIKQEPVHTSSGTFKQEPGGASSKLIKQEPVDTSLTIFKQEPDCERVVNISSGEESDCEIIEDGPDIDMISRMLDSKKQSVQNSIDTHNLFVRKIHAGQTLTKLEKKRYLKHERILTISCGFFPPNALEINEFDLKDVLLDVDSIPDLSEYPLGYLPHHHKLMKGKVPERKLNHQSIKANQVWHCERKGLQMLKKNPGLIPKEVRIAIQNFKEAQRTKNKKDMKRYRKEIRRRVCYFGNNGSAIQMHKFI